VQGPMYMEDGKTQNNDLRSCAITLAVCGVNAVMENDLFL
jgi:hypothetical protein